MLDWHPDALLATICVDEKGASMALQHQTRRTFLWLYSQGRDVPEDHLEGTLTGTCAPMSEVCCENDNVQQETSCSENDIPELRAVQELLHKHFTDETGSRKSTSRSAGARFDPKFDLPLVLRSLRTEDARLMWALGELVVDPPDFRSLDSCGQHFLFIPPQG